MELKRNPIANESEAYLRIGHCVLRAMERDGLVLPYRTPGGQHRYSLEILPECVDDGRMTPPSVTPVAS